MFAVPADKLLPGTWQLATQQAEAAAREFKWHILLIYQLEAMTSPQVQKPFSVHVFLGWDRALQAFLFGQA